MRAGSVRALLDRNDAGSQALLQAINIEERAAEIEVGIASLRVQGDDVTEEGALVPVDAGLTPAQGPEEDDNDDEDTPGRHSEGGAQHILAADGRSDEHRHHADAGQVLKTVDHERELHVSVVDETEHRSQRHQEECEARQRPTRRGWTATVRVATPTRR